MQAGFEEEETNTWNSQNLDGLSESFLLEDTMNLDPVEAAALLVDNRANNGAPPLVFGDLQANISVSDVFGSEFESLSDYELSPSLGRVFGLDSGPSGNNANGLGYLGPEPRMHPAANVDPMQQQQLVEQVELQPISNDIQVNGQMGGEFAADATADQSENRIFPRNELNVLENWKGEYGFTVKPIVDPLKKDKKMEYLEEKNKIFSKSANTVPFAIQIDFAKIPEHQEFKVRVCMLYEGADYFNDPVERCCNHFETERKVTSEGKMFRLPHVVRPVPADAGDVQYYTHPESNRSYLLFPLARPPVGMRFTRKDFCFTCLNSCESIKRRETSLMFSLYDNSGNLLGRSVTHLRICSAPGRDARKEEESDGRRKRKSDGNDQKVNLSAPPSKKVALPQIRCTVTAPADDDDLSSSQEVYSCDESHEEKIPLKKLIQDIRWALALKNSPDPMLKPYAKNVYQSLKLTQQLCTSAREQSRLSTLKEEERSPDGGFHDAGME